MAGIGRIFFQMAGVGRRLFKWRESKEDCLNGGNRKKIV